MIANMMLGIRYIVTVGSEDGTFLLGDKITLLKDGCIMCDGGWIEASEVSEATAGMKIKLDEEWINRKQAKLQAELQWLEKARLHHTEILPSAGGDDGN